MEEHLQAQGWSTRHTVLQVHWANASISSQRDPCFRSCTNTCYLQGNHSKVTNGTLLTTANWTLHILGNLNQPNKVILPVLANHSSTKKLFQHTGLMLPATISGVPPASAGHTQLTIHQPPADPAAALQQGAPSSAAAGHVMLHRCCLLLLLPTQW